MPMPVATGRSQLIDDASRQPSGSNYHVIAKVARDLLAEPDLAAKYLDEPIRTQTDLVDAVKNFCAAKKIDYGRRDAVPFDVVHRAVASEWTKAHVHGRRQA